MKTSSRLTRYVSTGLVGIMLAASAGVASAQTPQAQPNPGPVIPGVCVYSNEAVLVNSAVSKAAGARMDQITSAAEAELEPDVKSLEAERDGIAKRQQAGATREALDPAIQAFATRAQAFSDKAFIVQQELARTEQQANAQLSQIIAPVISAVYEARGCGLLVDRGAVIFANPQMDITTDVITRLDASHQTFDLRRVVLPEAERQKLLQQRAQQAAQQGG